MYFTVRHFNSLDPAKEYSALMEPQPGHTDAEIVKSLQDSGATKVKILSKGFISAQALGSALEKLRGLAEVHIKHESKLRP